MKTMYIVDLSQWKQLLSSLPGRMVKTKHLLISAYSSSVYSSRYVVSTIEEEIKGKLFSSI
jgi:hypothetical protein